MAAGEQPACNLGEFGHILAAAALILCLRPFIKGPHQFFGGLWMGK